MFIFEWGPEGGDGLVPAFERYVTSLANDHGLEVELTGPDAPLPLSRTTQIQLYGIAREALTNVIKHAGTGSARLSVEVEEDPRHPRDRGPRARLRSGRIARWALRPRIDAEPSRRDRQRVRDHVRRGSGHARAGRSSDRACLSRLKAKIGSGSWSSTTMKSSGAASSTSSRARAIFRSSATPREGARRSTR